MSTIDWMMVTMKLLRCFGHMEGTWYELDWEEFGITNEEQDEINKRFKEIYPDG